MLKDDLLKRGFVEWNTKNELIRVQNNKTMVAYLNEDKIEEVVVCNNKGEELDRATTDEEITKLITRSRPLKVYEITVNQVNYCYITAYSRAHAKEEFNKFRDMLPSAKITDIKCKGKATEKTVKMYCING